MTSDHSSDPRWVRALLVVSLACGVGCVQGFALGEPCAHTYECQSGLVCTAARCAEYDPKGCVPEEGSDPAPNTSAELTGDPIGPGEPDATSADVRRAIDVVLDSADADLEVLESFVLRRNASRSNAASFFARVRNTSPYGRCHILANRIEYRGAGDVLLGTSESFVRGAAGTKSGVTTTTCLWPGEVGWLSDVITDLAWDAGASVHVRLADEGRRCGYVRPAKGIVPVRYGPGTSGGFVVTVKNEAETALSVSSVVGWFLDDAGLPLSHEIDVFAPALAVAAGAELDVPLRLLFLEGRSTRLEARIDWSP